MRLASLHLEAHQSIEHEVLTWLQLAAEQAGSKLVRVRDTYGYITTGFDGNSICDACGASWSEHCAAHALPCCPGKCTIAEPPTTA